MAQNAENLLPTTATHVTPYCMTTSIDHNQLALWLVQVATKQDKAAFTSLFKFFAPQILRLSVSKYRNEVLANDIVQETMTNIWRKAHLFDPQKGAPTTWVYTVMRNVTFDMLRKMKTQKEDNLSDDFWPLAEASNVDAEPFSDHLANQQILSCINKLPEQQQQVVKGFYLQEMSQEQLADYLDIPLGTVKSRLRLALAKLKQHVGDRHD